MTSSWSTCPRFNYPDYAIPEAHQSCAWESEDVAMTTQKMPGSSLTWRERGLVRGVGGPAALRAAGADSVEMGGVHD